MAVLPDDLPHLLEALVLHEDEHRRDLGWRTPQVVANRTWWHDEACYGSEIHIGDDNLGAENGDESDLVGEHVCDRDDNEVSELFVLEIGFLPYCEVDMLVLTS